MIHTVKGFSIVNEAEVDVFLEFSYFLYDPVDVGNLISGSSAFSKSSLNVWKFLVQVLLKPSLKDFQCYLASKWYEQMICKKLQYFILHKYHMIWAKLQYFILHASILLACEMSAIVW